MPAERLPPLARFFRRVVARRMPILLAMDSLARSPWRWRCASERRRDRPLGWFAGDADAAQDREFHEIFPEAERVLLLAESVPFGAPQRSAKSPSWKTACAPWRTCAPSRR
jgi:hypothetical protein